MQRGDDPGSTGYRVVIFERDHFPRFHIGESLIPHTFDTLDRIGMIDKMKGSPFIKKYSVQFISETGRLSEPFYFAEHDPHQRSQTWQVRRAEFDQMMIENAREHGVTAIEGARVLETIFEGTRAVGVRVKIEGQAEQEVRASVVVDASGQSSMMIDRLGLRQWDPVLKKAALWTYWKGAKRENGIDEGATIVLQTEGKKGWFWYIPLQDDIVSVGVVASYDYLFQNRASKDLETIYFEEVARCPGLQPKLENATRCDVFRAQKEYSYNRHNALEMVGFWWGMPTASSILSIRQESFWRFNPEYWLAIPSLTHSTRRTPVSNACDAGKRNTSKAWIACGVSYVLSTMDSTSASSSARTQTRRA